MIRNLFKARTSGSGGSSPVAGNRRPPYFGPLVLLIAAAGATMAAQQIRHVSTRPAEQAAGRSQPPAANEGTAAAGRSERKHDPALGLFGQLVALAAEEAGPVEVLRTEPSRQTTAPVSPVPTRKPHTEATPTARVTPEGSSRADGDEIKVVIAGVVDDVGGLRALVISGEDNSAEWVGVGQRALGYTVRYISMRGVLLERDGQYYVLRVGERSGQQGVEAARLDESKAGASAVLGSAGATPTPAVPLSDRERLIGQWEGAVEGQAITLTLRADGTGEFSVAGHTESLTWDVANGQITFKASGNNTMVTTYSLEDGGRRLVIEIEEQTVVFTKL